MYEDLASAAPSFEDLLPYDPLSVDSVAAAPSFADWTCCFVAATCSASQLSTLVTDQAGLADLAAEVEVLGASQVLV